MRPYNNFKVRTAWCPVTRRFLWNRGRPRLSRWRPSSGFRPCELPTGNSHFRRWDRDSPTLSNNSGKV